MSEIRSLIFLWFEEVFPVIEENRIDEPFEECIVPRDVDDGSFWTLNGFLLGVFPSLFKLVL